MIDQALAKIDEAIEGLRRNADEVAENADEAVKIWGTTDNLINSATIAGNGGVTPVGRAFQKHAGNAQRAGTFVGEVTGNATKNTEQGLKYLNDILNNQNSTYVIRNTKAHGDILDVRLPDGTGARWSADFTNDPSDDYNLITEILLDDEEIAVIKQEEGELIITWYPNEEEINIPFEWMLGLMQEIKKRMR
jgi:hypothetical protein